MSAGYSQSKIVIKSIIHIQEQKQIKMPILTRNPIAGALRCDACMHINNDRFKNFHHPN